jgi:hypothetical protein
VHTSSGIDDGYRCLAGANALAPALMTADQRLSEVAQILAAGLVRLRQRECRNDWSCLEKNDLDFSPDRSVHASPNPTETARVSESILAQIAALKEKSTAELRTMWRELFDGDPPPFGRRYLEDRIAFRVQEIRFGGLSDRARRKLDALADQLEAKAARRRDPGRPIPGTQLRREWKGLEHVVTVRAHDFEYGGRPYKSLSAVARAITNTRWNGWLFFGLKSSNNSK